MKFNPMELVLGIAKSTNPIMAIGLSMAEEAMKHAGVSPEARKGAIAAVHQEQKIKAAEVIETHTTTLDATVVAVKSSWTSKINWVQFAGPAASALSAVIGYYGYAITPADIAGIFASGQVLQGLLTWVIRTWFTHSVTTASVAK